MPQTAGHTTSAPTAGCTGAEDQLNRGLGVGSIVFMVVAAAAPLSVVTANLPIVISASGNVAAPAYFVIAAIILALFSVGFTLMSGYVRNAGAFYSYVQAGLGRIPGVGAATLPLGSYLVLLIAVNAYAGVFVAKALEHYTGAATPSWAWSLATFALAGLLGYRNIELSSKVLGVLLVAETLIVTVLDFGIIAHGGQDGLSLAPFAPAAAVTGAPGLGIMFALFGFIGSRPPRCSATRPRTRTGRFPGQPASLSSRSGCSTPCPPGL
jgi:amino acid transporter